MVTAAATDAPQPKEDAQPHPKPRREPTSRPEYRVGMTFKSAQARRVYERSFHTMSYSAFSVDVILRVIGGKPDAVNAVMTLIDERIEIFGQSIEAELSTLKAKAQERGLKNLPSYSNPMEVEVAISSPQAGKISRLLLRFDELMSVMDMLWFNGELSGDKRIELQQNFERRFYSLAGFLFNIQGRARNQAKRQGKEDEVQAEAPEQADTAKEIADEAILAAGEQDGSEDAILAAASPSPESELAQAA